MAAVASGQNLEAAITSWKTIADGCRYVCKEISKRLEIDGVNLDIVTGLEIIDLSLTRMEAMIEVLRQPCGTERSQAIHHLLSDILQGIYHDRSIRHYLSNSTRLLHRKIVDRAGKTGEHYAGQTRQEYRQILIAASLGGLLTTLTAAIKIEIHDWQVAPFISGLAASLNYAITFLIMQACGMILATKQPAMTAAYLALIIREKQGKDRLAAIASFTASIVRCQLAAAVGNVMLVSVGAYLLDFLWETLFRQDLLTHDQAEHVFQALSPLDSGTFFYAALTGVLLWLGSLSGGWFERGSGTIPCDEWSEGND
jgi:site-specific recombinase